MSVALEPQLLHDLAQVVARRTGLHFPTERWPDLERGFRAAAATLAVGDPVVWAKRILAGDLAPRERLVLVERLTVGETYFLRQPDAFSALEKVVLPRLMAARAGTTRQLNLWSAGCCTGEEAYSLAVTCTRTIEDLPTWRVSVLATDANAAFIKKAERGVYGTWSFRGTPDWLRTRHFSRGAGSTWEIAAPLRRLVRFAVHNLAADPFPPEGISVGQMDVIFCRNVIMYLTPEHQRQVVASLHNALADDGCLVLSPAEGGLLLRDLFTAEQIGDTMVYRKVGAADVAVQRPTPAVLAPQHTTRQRHTRPAHATAGGTAPAPAPVSAPALTPVAPVVQDALAVVQPGAPDDMLVQARAAADRGQLEAAIPLCREAMRRDPASLSAAYLLGTVLQDLGRYDEEAVVLRDVLKTHPGFVLAHRALGDLERRRGKPADARRHYRQALVSLSTMDKAEIVPESDGITAGRLAEAIAKVLHV